MEMTSKAKDLIGLQKKAANNLFDAMALFQDQAERTNRYFGNQMGLSDEVQDYVDQWRTILKEGRDESRRFINESFTNLEDYFASLGPNKPSKKKKAVQNLNPHSHKLHCYCYVIKPIKFSIELGLPNFICINDVNSNTLTCGKVFGVLSSSIRD